MVLALLLGLAAWSVLSLQPPDPAPRTAPATQFSAERAAGTVQQIAARPHVAGSPADGQVTDALVAALRGMGLDTGVQSAVGEWPSGTGAADLAHVHNVVAVLPGTHSTGRLFLMAHHDSVQNGPGGSDDSAGVATVLETVRALRAGPPLRNDVVVVLTDAEEACLCGAEAFVADHPLAADGGVVLNLEARGTSGPPIMFETSTGNAALAERFAAAAPHPVASSVAVEVYRALPNDTDFSPVLRSGRFTGLNTAFIDGAAAYHTAQDTPARLDRCSLQALGDNTLALARALGAADLHSLAKPAAADATYFPVLGTLVHWSGRLVWPIAAAAVLAVAGLAWTLRRRGVSSFGRTAAGAGLVLLPLVLGPLAATGLWRLLVAVRPGYASMLDPWRPGWYRLAVVAVVVAVVLVWYALLRRRIGAAALATGALIWLALLGVALAAVAPGGSYLTALPALTGAVTGLAAAAFPGGPVRVAAGLVGGAVAVVVLAPSAALFFPALGLRTAAAPAAVLTLLALALLPAFELLFPAAEPAGPARPPRFSVVAVPLVAVLVAAGCTLAGLRVDRFDAAHPVPSQLAYALDTGRHQAWWVSTEAHPGRVTARYVSGRTPLPVPFPYLSGVDVATGPAQVAALPAPAVTVVGDRTVGQRRELTVRVVPRRAVRLVAFELTSAGGRITAARVDGCDVSPSALGGDRLIVTMHAPAADGVEALITVAGGGPLELRAIDGSDGLDGLPGYAGRPAGVQAAGSHSSDLVLVAATIHLG